MVKARLVQIGNSQGIRIPKAFIEQLNLQNEVTLEAQGDRLLIRAARPPRHGWAEQFALAATKQMTEAEEKEEADLLAFTNAPHLSSWEQNESEW